MIASVQSDLLEKISRDFGLPPEAWATTLVMVGILIVLASLLHLIFSFKGRGDRRTKRVFKRFAQASGLTGQESALLLSAARAARLEDTPAIFFRRSAFEEGMRRLDVPKGQTETLRGKVFGP